MPRQAGHHGETRGETFARFVVEHTLGERVCCYDDRRGESRPDAIIHRNGGVPLEIVSDPEKADLQLSAALEKISRRAHFDGLERGYLVSLSTRARVKDLSWLKAVLQQLEHNELRRSVPSKDVRYEFIMPDDRVTPGDVIFTGGGGGGGRSLPTPSGVVAAACAILARRDYADVAKKLEAYGGLERHAWLTVDEDNDGTFSWLRDATTRDLRELPTPPLAPEVTHLWIASRYISGLTLRWSTTDGWLGSRWDCDRYGHPIDALEAWEDPRCPVDHHPHAP